MFHFFKSNTRGILKYRAHNRQILLFFKMCKIGTKVLKKPRLLPELLFKRMLKLFDCHCFCSDTIFIKTNRDLP